MPDLMDVLGSPVFQIIVAPNTSQASAATIAKAGRNNALLKEVSQRLLSSTREKDVVAGFGGDEFAILQSCQENLHEGAIALANRIHDVIGAPYAIDGHQVIIGTSVGIAFAPEHGMDVDQLVKCADLALYQAKSEGRNRHTLSKQ